MYDVSVSKPVSGEKKGGWICSPTWKLDFTRPLIRIDYTSQAQSCQVSLNVAEPILTIEMLKKNLNYPNIFFDLNKSQKNILKKSNKTMKFCNKNLKFLKYSKSWYSNSKKKRCEINSELKNLEVLRQKTRFWLLTLWYLKPLHVIIWSLL